MMKRYYMTVEEGKPKTFSLLDLINSIAEDGVLMADQVELINIIKLGVDETINYKQSKIKRII